MLVESIKAAMLRIMSLLMTLNYMLSSSNTAKKQLELVTELQRNIITE